MISTSISPVWTALAPLVPDTVLEYIHSTLSWYDDDHGGWKTGTRGDLWLAVLK